MTPESASKQDHEIERPVRAMDLVAPHTACWNQKLLLQFGSSHKLMMGSLINTQAQMGSALAEPLRKVAAASEQLRLTMQRGTLPLANFQKVLQLFELSAAWHDRWAPLFGQVAEALKELPSRMREGLLALAHAGWYLDPEMPITAVTKFRDELESKPITEIQEALASYFREHLDRIETDLTQRHSHRSKLIGNAFAAHRAGNYDASIPLLFARVLPRNHGRL